VPGPWPCDRLLLAGRSQKWARRPARRIRERRRLPAAL